MSTVDEPSAPALSSWKACALHAKSIIERSQLPDALSADAAALDAAVAALLAREPGPVLRGAGAAEVFTFGSNDKGALGQGFLRSPNWEPARPAKLPPAAELREAIAGSSTCGFVTAAGELYLSGSNQHCVHGDRVSRGREAPVLVAALAGRKVTRAFMSGDSVHAFAFVDGRLHAWGIHASAVGLDKRSQTVEPTPIESLAGTPHEGGVGEDAVLHVALSSGHSMLIMQSGEVFTTGSNSRGQLGFGAPRNPYESFSFERPEGVEGLSFAFGDCGAMHTALGSSEGALYTFGQNEFGQLGLDGTDDRFRATQVASGSIAGKRIAQVVCGATFTLCVTDDGMLHGAGGNTKGELGLGEVDRSFEFAAVPMPAGTRVERISAGGQHALALCADGALYGWGDNSLGQVTPGEKGRAVREPVRLDFFADKAIAHIAAGKAHSLVVVGG